MKMKLTTAALAAIMAAGPVMADLVFPSLSYRTGPYASGGIPFADGYADYFTLLNERDGGIGGVGYVFAALDQQTLDATIRASWLPGRNTSVPPADP